MNKQICTYKPRGICVSHVEEVSMKVTEYPVAVKKVDAYSHVDPVVEEVED